VSLSTDGIVTVANRRICLGMLRAALKALHGTKCALLTWRTHSRITSDVIEATARATSYQFDMEGLYYCKGVDKHIMVGAVLPPLTWFGARRLFTIKSVTPQRIYTLGLIVLARFVSAPRAKPH
jgi:hypothetical protein